MFYHDRLKKVLVLLIIFTITISSFSYVNQIALAESSTGIEPDIILYIHGEQASGGPIFHEAGDLSNGAVWAPGTSNSGIIRIYNNYSERIKVTNLALSINIQRLINGEYENVDSVVNDGESEIYKDFAENMELTVEKGLFVFDSTIFNGTFLDMLYISNDLEYTGFDLTALGSFNIDKGKYIDLKYTVKMNENAGNNLQGIKVTVNFMINAQENPKPPITVDPSDNGDSDNNNEQTTDSINNTPVDIIGHWSHDCVITLMEKGIVTGYSDGTIRPDNYITRAETAALLARALQLNEEESTALFYNDNIPSWAVKYVSLLTNNGIFKGFYGKLFKPDKELTREEFAAVLVRAFKGKEEEIDLLLTDQGNISNWALEEVEEAIKGNLLQQYPDGSFKPQDKVTRAEAFYVICKLLGYHDNHIEVGSDDI